MTDDTSISNPVLKATTAVFFTFAGHTVSEWAQLAGLVSTVLASVYCGCLITEWLWKRIAKPVALYYGWIEGAPRPFLSSTIKGDL